MFVRLVCVFLIGTLQVCEPPAYWLKKSALSLIRVSLHKNEVWASLCYRIRSAATTPRLTNIRVFCRDGHGGGYCSSQEESAWNQGEGELWSVEPLQHEYKNPLLGWEKLRLWCCTALSSLFSRQLCRRQRIGRAWPGNSQLAKISGCSV